MRKFTFATILLCIGSFGFSQNSDEDNIKKVLETERAAYHGRNFEAWKNTWRQDANVLTISNTPYTYRITKGWDSVQARVEKDFKSPSPYSEIKYDNISIHQHGNMALVNYNMILSPIDASPELYPYISVQQFNNVQVFVKENDQWKTVSRIVMLPGNYASNFDIAAEDKLNNAGYDLLGANKIAEAIEVFKLNVKFYPKSWNTYDSLGEAYALLGNKKLAIENYEKSVKINSKSESGLTALAKLKQK